MTTELRLEDWTALARAARHRVQQTGSRSQRLAERIPAALFAASAVLGLTMLARPDSKLAWAGGIVLTLCFIAAAGHFAMRRSRPLAGGAFLGPARLDFTVDGLGIERPRSRSFVHWSQVLEVELLPGHLVLWVDATTGYVIPTRDTPLPLTPAELATRVRALRDAAVHATASAQPASGTEALAGPAPATAPQGASASPPVADVTGDPIERPRLLHELAALVRLLLLRPVDGMRLAGSDVAIAAAAAASLVAWVWLDRVASAETLIFAPYAVAGLAWFSLGFLGLAWALWRLAAPRATFRRVLLVTVGAVPIAIAGSILFDLLGSAGTYAVVAVCGAWALLYFRSALLAVTGARQSRALVVGAVAASVFIVGTHEFLGVSPTLWDYPDDGDDQQAASTSDASADSDEVWAHVASLQFGQQARIDAELAKIAQHASPRPEVFFLGFAGNGRQRVFAEEIALAAKVVGARYDAGERELRLVNDARDLERWPLATPEALRHALLGLGRLMDPEDVLFLAVSSHGGEDGSIEVANAGMVSVGLGAEELEHMLRAARIPRTVVVISACYAGAFVPVIADENATVIAAAAADRTSFGCADDRDLTYFGEAFYRDALPSAPTLRDAFEQARGAIAARERREGMEPSLPQARIGTLVEQRLARLVPGGT